MVTFSSKCVVRSAFAVIVTSCAFGCNSETDPSQETTLQAAQNDSPQAAFDSAKAAAKKKDYLEFCRNLTPTSRDTNAGVLIATAAVMESTIQTLPRVEGRDIKRKALENFAPIYAVLEKHGVDFDGVKAKMRKRPDSGGSNQGDPTELVVGVKDKTAFMADMMDAMEKSTELQGGKFGCPIANTTLTELKVDGDSASATLVTESNGNRQPVTFKRINGTWLIDLPVDMR